MTSDSPAQGGRPGRLRQDLRAALLVVKDDPRQALLACLPLLLCIPWNPGYSSRNYEYQLHLAYATGIQYGKDILATYGPLGFLTIPFFHPRTFPILIAFNVLVYLFLIVRLSAVSRALGEARYGARVCFVCLPAAVINVPEWSAVLFVPYILALTYGLDVASSGWDLKWRTAAIYGILFAAFTLAKMTFAPLILPVLMVCGIAQVLRGSAPRTVAAYAAALPILWVASGQSLGNIPAFVANSSEIVSGYKDEMEYWEWPAIPSMIFLAAAHAVLWSAATIAAWRAGRRMAIVVSTSLLLAFYASLLNGFVRGDSYHVLPCILTTFGLWAIVDLVIASTRPRRGSRLVTASWLAFGMILLSLSYEWRMLGGDASHASLKQIAERPKGLARLVLRGTRHLKAKVLEDEALLRAQAVPGLKGLTVDVPNGDPGLASASGARVRLRPTVTAYSGYTPALTRANADYLEGDRGPKGILLLMFPLALDGKFPTSEDPRAWLSLLTHYQHSLISGAYEFFKRRPDPLEARLVPLIDRTVSFDEGMDVPRDASRAIWAEIEVTPTIAGRLAAAAFKPIPVHLVSTLANGSEVTNRINVRMAKTGFLLSPYIGDRETLRALFADDRKGLGPQVVKSIRIDGAFRAVDWTPGIRLKPFYEEKIKVRLFSLHLDPKSPPRDAARSPGEAGGPR